MKGASAITLASLADHQIWVGRKKEERNGQLTQVAYDLTGRFASANDPATWATHDEADGWAATNGADGVGLMLSQIDDAIIGEVDLAGCRDPNTETIEPWAQAVIDRFDTYTETSPSGTDVGLLFTFARADLPAVEALFGGKYARMFERANGNDHPRAIAIHRGHRCFAVTGDTISETDAFRLVDLADLQWLIGDHGPKFAGPGASAGIATQQGDDGRSGRAFRIGVILAATGASYEDMRNALLTYANPEIPTGRAPKGWPTASASSAASTERLEAAIRACASNTSSRTCNPRDTSTSPPVTSGQRSASTRDCRRSRKSTAMASRCSTSKTGKPETIQPSAWLARHAPVEQMTWAPGLPQLIRDNLIGDGGWIEHEGVTVFNLYRPPKHRARRRDQSRAMDRACQDHLSRRGRPHHRVARPSRAATAREDQPRARPRRPSGHRQGHPARAGQARRWRRGTSPRSRRSRCSAASTASSRASCCGSEATDMGEFDRFKLYAHMKTMHRRAAGRAAGRREEPARAYVFNVCGVVLTTNHKTDGIYLPADDRRHFVAWSEKTKDDFAEAVLERPLAVVRSGGFGHVAAYLAEFDLSDFNPKAPPTKTAAFWAIVDANRPPEDAELADVLDELRAARRCDPGPCSSPRRRVDLRTGCSTARTGASSLTGSNGAAMSQCATTPPTTAFSRSRSGDRSFMDGPTFP